MTKEQMQYKSGYKYQLVKKYSTSVNVTPDKDIKIDYISLKKWAAYY